MPWVFSGASPSESDGIHLTATHLVAGSQTFAIYHKRRIGGGKGLASPDSAPAIHRIDPLDFIQPASIILREAWCPPCLDYSEDLVRWQCHSPGDLQRFGVVGYHQNYPVSFVAVNPHLTSIGQVYFSSFFSSIPGVPATVPIGVIREEARLLYESKAHCVIFSQPDSVGDQMLAWMRRSGLKQTRLNDALVYMATPRPTTSTEARETSAGQWLGVYEQFPVPASALSTVWDDATLLHAESHPWRRRFLVATRDNKYVGCAIAEATRIQSRKGQVDVLPSLHHARATDSDSLKALIAAAADDSKVVSLPNCTLPPEMMRASYARATAKYRAYLYSADELPTIESTWTEII
jgi:hypothetical protein